MCLAFWRDSWIKNRRGLKTRDLPIDFGPTMETNELSQPWKSSVPKIHYRPLEIKYGHFEDNRVLIPLFQSVYIIFCNLFIVQYVEDEIDFYNMLLIKDVF